MRINKKKILRRIFGFKLHYACASEPKWMTKLMKYNEHTGLREPIFWGSSFPNYIFWKLEFWTRKWR